MTNLKAKITSALAIASVAAATFAPAAFADTTVVIKDNGVDSTNKVEVENENKTYVNQSNETFVVNSVNVNGNTGGNDANKNTNGNVGITTGDVKTKVKITNEGSVNLANVDPCGCPEGNTTVKIKNNGEGSYNKVEVENENKLKVKQSNKTAFINNVGANGNTGWNDANWNTGGTTSITTGDVKTKVKIKNTGSINTLNP